MDLHANFFRSTFSDPEQAAGLLRTFLPAAIAKAIDWSKLELCDTSFVDQDLRHSDADLLFSVLIGGRPAFLYLLVEHKSTADPLTAWQQLRYVVRVWEQWCRDHPGATALPPILPLVVHHGPQGWHCARDVVELIDLDGLLPDVIAMLQPHLPRLAFLLADMPEVHLDRLRNLAMPPLARLALVMLQFLRGQDEAGALAVVRAAIGLLRQVYFSPGGSERLDQVWFYSFMVSDLRPAPVRELVATMIDPRAGDTVMTTADRIREEERVKFMRIREEEHAKFMATANHIREEERVKFMTTADRIREEERSATLLRLIEKRFGPVPETVRTRVAQASMADLERWLDGILDAPTLTALFAD